MKGFSGLPCSVIQRVMAPAGSASHAVARATATKIERCASGAAHYIPRACGVQEGDLAQLPERQGSEQAAEDAEQDVSGGRPSEAEEQQHDRAL